jgi:cellobiose phosphorylase
MYRLITESLLGIKREGESLRLEPCLPEDWVDFKIRYRFRDTLYHIIISQTTGDESGSSVTLDNIDQHESSIPLLDDRIEHRIEVKIVRERKAVLSGTLQKGTAEPENRHECE